MKLVNQIFIIILSLLINGNCFNHEKGKTIRAINNLKGSLVIFHAGSLTIPMKEITEAFKKENPDVTFQIEIAGSVECARKITELNKQCDVFASADYTVIDKLLIPKYADWNIKFASNEMAIVYTNKSKRSKEINKENWYKIMLDKNIRIARADPNSDPCGYRSVFVTKLAEKYYKQPGLSDQLLKKDENNMRPKETDLLALLESGNVDYIFIYRSVAEQHKLKYIILPEEVNLKNGDMTTLYNTVSVEINGKTPKDKIIQKGEPMVYGITIPKNAPNKSLAIAFVKFLLTKEKGIEIFERLGQPSLVPSYTSSYDKIPVELKSYARK